MPRPKCGTKTTRNSKTWRILWWFFEHRLFGPRSSQWACEMHIFSDEDNAEATYRNSRRCSIIWKGLIKCVHISFYNILPKEWLKARNYGSSHAKMCLRAYTDKDGLDQPAHPHMIRTSLSADRIIGYYRMYKWRAKPRLLLCAYAGWCESAHSAHVRRHFFAWYGPYIVVSGKIFLMFSFTCR